jgi:hypothetical protein
MLRNDYFIEQSDIKVIIPYLHSITCHLFKSQQRFVLSFYRTLRFATVPSMRWLVLNVTQQQIPIKYLKYKHDSYIEEWNINECLRKREENK